MTAAPRPVPWRCALELLAPVPRSRLALHATLLIAAAALPLLGLFAMQWLVDAVADGVRGSTPAGDATGRVLQATGFAALVAVAGHTLRSVSAVLGEDLGRRLADAATGSLQRRAAELDLAEYDRPEFHDLLQRAGGEAAQRPVRLLQDLGGLIAAAVQLVAMGTVLALVEPWLALGVAAAAAPVSLLRARHARARYRWQEQNVGRQRDVGYLGAVLTGRSTAKDVRALGVGDWFAARLAALRAELRASLQGLAQRRAREELIVHALASLAVFAAYLHLGLLALASAMTLGGLVLHAQAVQRLQNGVRDLLGAAAALGEDRLFLRPWLEFFARQPTLRGGPAQAVAARPPHLAATRVEFTYPGGPAAALRGIDLAIEPGELVAVVGANGSGKSTLLKLLLRLYDPTTGCVSADGVDLRSLEGAQWRRRVAVLLQDAQAFELPLRTNLGLPQEAEPTELWRVLEVVGLQARVRSLPAGLETPLSRRIAGGVDLSGGELRRLVLARALLQPADVLLLDEPFAQLDGAVATQVVDELRRRRGRQTVVVVDHRRAAVDCADRLVWLDHGELRASGAPAAMLAKHAGLRALFPG